MQWKLEELIASADAFDVARSIGMTIVRSGATYYTNNVEGRPETRLNHNQLFHDGCKDYTSGASHNTYGMVREYFSKCLGRELTHDEICSIIADTCGGADLFIVKKDRKKKSGMPFPLTKSDLELLGLAPKNRYQKEVVSYSDYKDDVHTEICGDGYAKTKPMPPISIYSLYKEDKEAFWWLVKEKLQDCIIRQKQDYHDFKDLDGDCAFKETILKECAQKFQMAISLKNRLSKLVATQKAS